MNVCGTVSYLPPEGILALDNKHLGYIGCVYPESQHDLKRPNTNLTHLLSKHAR